MEESYKEKLNFIIKQMCDSVHRETGVNVNYLMDLSTRPISLIFDISYKDVRNHNLMTRNIPTTESDCAVLRSELVDGACRFRLAVVTGKIKPLMFKPPPLGQTRLFIQAYGDYSKIEKRMLKHFTNT